VPILSVHLIHNSECRLKKSTCTFSASFFNIFLQRLPSACSLNSSRHYADSDTNMSTTNVPASSLRSRYAKSAIEEYPPIRALSKRQESIEVFLGGKFDPSDYASFTFSPAFEQVYGKPTIYYSDFHRLMVTPFNSKLFPKIRKSFMEIAQDVHFLYFCNIVDQVAKSNSLPIPG